MLAYIVLLLLMFLMAEITFIEGMKTKPASVKKANTIKKDVSFCYKQKCNKMSASECIKHFLDCVKTIEGRGTKIAKNLGNKAKKMGENLGNKAKKMVTK